MGADDATQLLVDWKNGDERARDALLPLVYGELRRIAGGYMRDERPDHTLQPTALVHEAFLRLIDQRRVDWTNRAQFVGMAAVMMRRILVNHARDRAAAKRGAGVRTVPITGAGTEPAVDGLNVDIIALHDALERLEAIDSRKSRILELKFFGGLTIAEVAEALQISHATIERDWSFARAWLYDALAGGTRS